MEAKLLELFPDETVPVAQYRSFVNQPERIQISSQEDISDYDPNTLTTYYNFKVRLPRPALNVKTLQLARASIPNIVASFPDTECTFWYYALPPVAEGNIYENNGGIPGDLAYTFDTSGNVFTPGDVLVPNSAIYFDTGNMLLAGISYTYDEDAAYNDGNGNAPVEVYDGNDLDYFIEYTGDSIVTGSRRLDYLRYVRLLPSFVQPDLMIGSFTGSGFGFNRVFADYEDLLTELQKATGDDPLDQTAMNNLLNSFRFVANDISFSLNTQFNRFVMTGNDIGFTTYLPVASDDELLPLASELLKQRDILNDQGGNFAQGAIAIVQPWIPYRTLNLRLGFNYAIYGSGPNYLNMLRPHPDFVPPDPPLSLGNWFTEMDHLAPGYCDLVNTSCCHIYCDVTGGSTVDSIANKALLATIPLNTGQLGVGFHSLPLSNPLTKIVDQIYEIYIELRTDTGQPFYLGNNAIVSLELILTY